MACKPEEVSSLPRRFRLTRREGFTGILQKRARTNSWFAVHSEANQARHARLGMSVSKRVLPSAVQRNVVKRMIRECFRKYAHQSVASDIVIRLRKPLRSEDISKARFSLLEMLNSVLAEK